MDVGQSGRDLTLLDAVCAVMDRPRRPLDFTVIVDLPASLSLDALRAGARSARRRYPVSAARLVEGRWRPGPERVDAGVQSVASTDVSQALRTFIDEPIDLHVDAPVRQVVIDAGGGRVKLASRFHHAAADGMSASAWLGHALEVARGDRNAFGGLGAWTEPVLREGRHQGRHPTGRRSSTRLWRRAGSPTRRRRWQTIELERPDRRERFGGRFTYSDLLATIAIDVLGAWNRSHGARQSAPVGLWLPVSVRAAGDTAFGNGTSRIRMYAATVPEATFEAKCVAVREQRSAALQSGEWRVPASQPAGRLPWTLRARVLRAYLSRPWADTGTTSFSHIDRWTGPPAALFDATSCLECVASLHAGQPLAITGVTRGRRTWLTFTYDAALLTDGDVVALTQAFVDSYAVVRRSVACAA